jgi:hypothetical protein
MGCAAAAADQHNPMEPIPPERREAIRARLSGPAREPVARVAANAMAGTAQERKRRDRALMASSRHHR